MRVAETKKRLHDTHERHDLIMRARIRTEVIDIKWMEEQKNIIGGESTCKSILEIHHASEVERA